MLKLADAGTPIDLVTMYYFLTSEHELEAVGGNAYLTTVVDGAFKVPNVVHYARIVKEKAVKHILAHASEAQLHDALNGETAFDALKAAKERIFALEGELEGVLAP